jgi:hypothetical protein
MLFSNSSLGGREAGWIADLSWIRQAVAKMRTRVDE